MIIAIVDAVLVLRVWILYGRSRKIMIFLTSLMISEVTILAIVAIIVCLPRNDVIHLSPQPFICYYSTKLSLRLLLTLYLVPIMIVSSIMFVMTLYKCRFTIVSPGRQMPVSRLFARDGVIWFLAVLLVTIADIIVWSVGRPSVAQANISISCSLLSIIASRVLFNIKEVVQSSNNLTPMYSMALGDIEFSTNPHLSHGAVTPAG